MSVDNANITVNSDVSLTDAMQTIDKNTLGTVFVVDDDGRLVGIATDGDIRRGIVSGMDVTEAIREVMNESPLYIRDSWSDDQIQRWLNSTEVRESIPQHRVLVLPVLDESDRVVDYVYVNENNDIVNETNQPNTSVNSVLVIGGAGYIGSVLCRMLLDRGYEVRALDTLLYGRQGVKPLLDNDSFILIEGDMRSIETVMEAVQGVDAVFHLGALVGDPASSIDPQKTLELNYHAVKMVAEICKYQQINRFVFASTCSVYGRSTSPENTLTEESELNPVSLYAKSKIESERALLAMRDGNFSPTIFRKATVYGLSPRMRFDLVVNILTAKAFEEGTIPIFGGDQFRPNVHVADVARAYIDCIEAPIEDVDGEVFNVGSNEQNYRIKELGSIVSDCFPDADIDLQADKEDDRSYKVDFSKIQNVLGYETEFSIRDGCLQIKDALESGDFEDYTAQRYSNYRTLENEVDIFQPEEVRG